jgi:hypothetical protein
LNAVINERCQHLLSIKQDPGLSPHLRKDPRDIAAIRARLRLDRAKLNASLADRKIVPSPLCGFCLQHRHGRRIETPDHVLLSCPRYRAARRTLQDLLTERHLDLSLPLLLGEWSKPVCQDLDLLRALRVFLRSVQQERDM